MQVSEPREQISANISVYVNPQKLAQTNMNEATVFYEIVQH